MIGQIITFTPLPNSTLSDSFTYTVTDSLGASVTGTVRVAITTPAASPSGAVTFMPGGQAIISLTGVAGQTYVLQGSSDLLTWIDLCQVIAAPDGTIQVEDGDAASYKARYYKLRLP